MSTATDIEKQKYYLESQKVVFDLIKHLGTVATGVIVLLATLLDKVFPNPSWKFLVILTFVSLLVSVVALAISALGVVASLRTPDNVSEGLRRLTGYGMFVGLASFLTGIAALAIFATRNWW